MEFDYIWFYFISNILITTNYSCFISADVLKLNFIYFYLFGGNLQRICVEHYWYTAFNELQS